MSINNYILNLLNIKDNNIYILSNTLETKVIKGKNYKIIRGIITYIPECCPFCGCVNESHNDIIKWGVEEITKSRFQKYLIVILCLFYINRDFIKKIVIIHLLLKQIL